LRLQGASRADEGGYEDVAPEQQESIASRSPLPNPTVLLLDIRLLHAALQRGAPQPEPCGATCGPRDSSTEETQGIENSLALGVFIAADPGCRNTRRLWDRTIGMRVALDR
jgi:hypothetical protein